MKVDTHPADNVLHWFCSKADPLVVEAATFLLRLFAYDSAQVNEWKAKLKLCLGGCSECVQMLNVVKVSSRTTYFGAFQPDILDKFYQSFTNWEILIVKEALGGIGVVLNNTQLDSYTLSRIPGPILYHTLSSLKFLEDASLLFLVRSCPKVQGWNTDVPPAGLLPLMMDESPEVRNWSRGAVSSKVIPTNHFVAPYKESLGISLAALATTANGGSVGNFAYPSLDSGNFTSFPFSKDPVELWMGFTFILRLIPSDVLAQDELGRQCRRVVISHVNDIGQHFSVVLRCLLLLMKRLQNKLWKGEAPDYAQVVFDSIKDNQSFSELISNGAHEEKPWFLSWFGDYLDSVPDSGVFSNILSKIVDFLCEELQHERFQEARPVTMLAASRVILFMLRKHQDEGDARRRTALSSVLDIHGEKLINVAFRREFSDSKWGSARASARELVSVTLARDVCAVSDAIDISCRVLAGREREFCLCQIRRQMWKRVYGSLQSNDADALTAVIKIIAESSHLDHLTKNAYKPVLSKPNMEAAIESVNASLAAMRDGLLDAISRVSNYSNPTQLTSVLADHDFTKNVMVIMLSPIDDLQAAAKTLVGQAYDVDGRLDCIRALLKNQPDGALAGIHSFLEKFISFSPLVAEACSLSKSLVQCFTDIIEVLCSSPDGLLHERSFLQPRNKPSPGLQLPQLWNLMTRAITVIFQRIPVWAGYFEVEDMTVWLRDALIFGRDLLEQRRVIEEAALSVSNEPPLPNGKRRALSRLGKKMIDDLKPVLPELARWLRLSDQELLHQAFALIQSLLDVFRKTGVPPPDTGLAKLNKHIEDARKPRDGRPKTCLNAAQLTKLENAIASFDSDDEVEIIERPAVKTKKTEEPSIKASTKPNGTQNVGTLPTRSDTLKDVAHGKTGIPEVQVRVPPRGPPVPVRPPRPPSPETSSDESETEAGGLASLGKKFQKSPKVAKPTHRRQVKMLDVTNQGQSAMLDRLSRRDDARKAALRMKPDISGLHRAILAWDYDHEGPEPPYQGSKPHLFHVGDKFIDHRQYLKTFEPLLLLEAWAQIVQSKEEREESYECKITSRHFIDDFVDMEASISEMVQKDWRLTEMDVILLRHPSNKKCILAKAVSYRRTHFGSQVTLRCYIPNGSSDPGLQIHSVWQLRKVFSLSTLHREYAALMALPYYDLFSTIMNPVIKPIPRMNQDEVKRAMNTYKINEPQAKAILGSLSADGFALIQGPPGTGKTSTICGLVEGFIAKRRGPATSIQIGRSSTNADKAPVQKVLICAPSNAAIDEVANRLKDGFRGPQVRNTSLKVVRIGTEKAMGLSVKDIALDYLVDQKINDSPGTKNTSKESGNEINVLRAEIESVKNAKQVKVEELATVHDNTARTMALEEEIKKLNSRRLTLTQQIDRLRDKQKSDSRTLDAIRRRFRAEILQEADVICSTLSGAGHETIEQLEFEMVIIDEAAQAIELSSLIPLKFPCARCILVGDPQQLPPTVLSQDACKYLYNQSLFVRLQKHRPDAVHLLSIQYRMHPDISRLPSRIFYQGRLQDGPGMAEKTRQVWHDNPLLGTYRFFNVSKGQESESNGRSLKNVLESQVAVALFSRLRTEYKGIDFDFRVGVVSMYRGQVLELQRAFEQRFGADIKGKVQFHTVDGFQGQEKDIIILSCVRAGPGLQSVGFLSDVRRMNVSITRAKSSLFILGNAATLERSDSNWRQIIQDARTRNVLTDVGPSYFTTPGATKPSQHPTPKPAKQKASAENKPSAPPPLPNLLTPQQLAGSSVSTPLGLQPVSVNANASPMDEDKPPLSNPPIDESKKRPRPDLSNDPPNEAPKPKPPPVKKFKKDKGSIFIPKKKPQGGPSKPS
ncbi:hypothetical protein CONPUDRAFT_104043 [Coniophora puteana RWD-64-598 SS2]|uniref:Helicase ATP-binding domain-containing protein n=1 Tax=Coniophora puteana (strain RWD-64-598) TaxID=741705 RepID=A0A5M3MP73_CONPW|nr:uncharacterized protein CONPUDRAFT_104043 [Coniophora puteana RWD-64-598 SS2]EIW80969.1 hypothetical protein CONPUDRAFT_104043 [Coniophora puteana RWD-64-598 SS2]